MTAPVLLFGATGTVGRATAQALVAKGRSVVAAGRRDPVLDGVIFAPADLQDPASLAQVMAIRQPRAVISCLASRTGAPQDAWAIDHDAQQHILAAALEARVSHFVLLSAICVQKPRLAFQHAKLAFEASLEKAAITHSIVRPTALFKSLSGQLARVQAGKPYLMFGDGTLTACTPISDGDLARYMIRCLDDPACHNAVLPIGGPHPALTPRDIGAALFERTGIAPRYRRVPPALLSTIAGGLGLAAKLSPKLQAKAEFARIGHYYATESMLVWDAENNRYDAGATPATGQDHLFDYFDDLIAGRATLDRGDHAVF